MGIFNTDLNQRCLYLMLMYNPVFVVIRVWQICLKRLKSIEMNIYLTFVKIYVFSAMVVAEFFQNLEYKFIKAVLVRAFFVEKEEEI